MPIDCAVLKLDKPAHYRIGIQGVLDESWSHSFASLAIACDLRAKPMPVTILSGPVLDQAMLLGVLNGLYSLGLCLLFVECVVEDVGRSNGDMGSR